jgi:hypothetical protein
MNVYDAIQKKINEKEKLLQDRRGMDGRLKKIDEELSDLYNLASEQHLKKKKNQWKAMTVKR